MARPKGSPNKTMFEFRQMMRDKPEDFPKLPVRCFSQTVEADTRLQFSWNQ